MDGAGEGGNGEQGTAELIALRAELASLRERVVRLERGAELAAAQAYAPTSAAAGTAGRSTPGLTGEPDRERPPARLSFTQPERPSLESRIGSQLFNRVGIVALLVGSAWFLKYAVDQQWLGPAARVWVGIVAGIALIGWSERFRRRGYPVFSYSLKAVGTGMLYLTLWASFALFHLLGYGAAFAGMALITLGNAWLCWAQRSEVLAGYVAIGGFLTPALLAGEQTSVVTLGSYLALLDAGLLGLMALRRWPRLLPAAFVGTAGYLADLAWRTHGVESQGDGPAATVFILVALVSFSLAPVVALRLPLAPIGGPERSEPARLGGTGSRGKGSWPGTTALGMAAGVAIANGGLSLFALWRFVPDGSFWAHWLPALLAAWYALLLALLRGRRLSAAALAPVHAGLVIGLAALGVWTGLSGGGVIAGWVLEAIVLLLLSQRTAETDADRVLRSPVPACGLLVGAGLLLIAESLEGPLSRQAQVLWNERAGLYLLAIAGAVLTVRLAAREHAGHREDAGAWRAAGLVASLLATGLLLLGGCFEIHTYWEGAGGTAEQFWTSAWATLLGVGLLGLGFRVRWAFLRWQALTLLTLAVAKVFLVDTRSLSQGFRILSFLGLGVLLLVVSFIYQRDLLKLRGREHGE